MRLIETLQPSARIYIPGPDGMPMKAYKGGSNQCFEFWRGPDGNILSQTITTWECHNLTTPKRPHPAARRLVRLFKNDMVAIEKDGTLIICYVQKTDPANGAFLVPHNEA